MTKGDKYNSNRLIKLSPLPVDGKYLHIVFTQYYSYNLFLLMIYNID